VFVFCVLCFVFCILYFVFCILYFVFCILYFVFCILYFVFLYCVFRILYFVFCILNFECCILYFVFCMVYFVFCGLLAVVLCLLSLSFVLCLLYLYLYFVFCLLYSVFCLFSSFFFCLLPFSFFCPRPVPFVFCILYFVFVLCVCVCVCACARACMRACVLRACVRMVDRSVLFCSDCCCFLLVWAHFQTDLQRARTQRATQAVLVLHHGDRPQGFAHSTNRGRLGVDHAPGQSGWHVLPCMLRQEPSGRGLQPLACICRPRCPQGVRVPPPNCLPRNCSSALQKRQSQPLRSASVSALLPVRRLGRHSSVPGERRRGPSKTVCTSH